ncbi:50S ribosomal protein L4 [Candidatus Phytoplasma australiense]|uniref:Large ribosomal subunit protein uL4 n=2 Tax=Phytoplasma australiense TaxID=59748 RepID=RL4_PHYAS|nr:50S ribosomal protein L4 [Candidatus Phytoplasma australiense]B1VAE7.1 RecName: Full=Large ribosomal subunit protein uL4; AltName: Full=50S ribosomal protein L4 [Candidatus Phytoplasma australiense]AGL90307.1 50S ribosomal protein L4 [Strawberry lethal yellows phytoplasma (CPA) str. NZSb11]CAM11920.1 50S ribosomal protein L4 [Candidatus Phytoplasma australiense]
MPKYNVINQLGDLISTKDLKSNVFDIQPHQQALYDVINAQRAAMRQGTHATKTRAFVSGGGKKPWRQKGTGRARHGSIRSPLWRGGGVVFGPSPRNYSVKVNQKVSHLALKSALSSHFRQNQLILVDDFNLDTHKSKDFQKTLQKLNVTSKALIIVTNSNRNLTLASRNLPYVTLETAAHASVYQILNCKNLILTLDAVAYFEEVLK